MAFWLFVYLGALLLSVLGQEKRIGKSARIFRVLLVIFISFVTLLISGNGSDIEGYRRRFEISDSINSIVFSLASFEAKEYVEVGYNIVALLLHYLHFGFPRMLLLTFLFINSVFVHFVFKFKFPILGIVAFLVSITFSQEINLQRQMIAIAIFFLSAEQVEKGKPLRSLLLILVAVLFHSSVIFLAPFVLLHFVDLSKHFRTVKIICGIGWFMSILVSIGLLSVNGILGGLTGLLGDSHYSEYLTTDNDVGMDTEVSLVFQALMFFVFVSNNRQNVLYLILFSFGCIFTNISTALPNFVRFAFYFSAFCPLYLAQLVGENMTSKYSIISYMYCGYYFVLRLFLSISSRAAYHLDFNVLHGLIQ